MKLWEEEMLLCPAVWRSHKAADTLGQTQPFVAANTFGLNLYNSVLSAAPPETLLRSFLFLYKESKAFPELNFYQLNILRRENTVKDRVQKGDSFPDQWVSAPDSTAISSSGLDTIQKLNL